MPSTITATERQLIDSAVAAGMVEVVEPGRSAWEEVEGISISPGTHHTIRKKQEIVIARRKKIRRLLHDGLTDKQIHAAFTDCPSTVQKDLRWVRGAQPDHIRQGHNLPRAAPRPGGPRHPAALRVLRPVLEGRHVNRIHGALSMRYAHNDFGSPPIGVEPQPDRRSVEITDYEHRNMIVISDRSQLLQIIQLLRDAGFINGWEMGDASNR